MQIDYDTRMTWLSWIVLDNAYSVDAIKRIRTRIDAILADDFLWQDVILRHGFSGVKPWDARNKDGAALDHAMGNFWGMIGAYNIQVKQ